MGGHSSKHAGKVIKTNESALQVDHVPYPGPCWQYSFMNVNVQMQSHMTFNFSPGTSLITSNVDAYYPSLAQSYNDGFKLAAFFKIPGSQQRAGGLFSMAVNIPYQVVYCRKVLPDQPPQAVTWQLKIEKSLLHMSNLRAGVLFSLFAPREITADLSHLYQIICQNAEQGGRFVCMELTGQTTTQGMGAAMHGVSPGYGIDLFFNMPLHPNPVIYTYMAVSVPIQLSHSFTSIDIFCDWMGNLAQYTNQGWRLADIFLVNDGMLLSATDKRKRNAAALPTYLNSIWFFEKERSRVEDPTPVYECTYVEYHVKMQVGFTGVSSDFNVSDICQKMGNQGWKLVCFIDTPKMVSRGFTSVTMAVMLFFQRRILTPQNVGLASAPHVPQIGDEPPSYPGYNK